MSLTEDLKAVDPLDRDPELWDWDDEEPEDPRDWVTALRDYCPVCYHAKPCGGDCAAPAPLAGGEEQSGELTQ